MEYWPMFVAAGGWIVSVEVRQATVKQKLIEIDKKLDTIIESLLNKVDYRS